MGEFVDQTSEAAIRQQVRDRQYRKDYKEWIESLDADQLAELKALDLHEPAGNGGVHGGDPLDTYLADPRTAAWHPGQPVPDNDEEIEYDSADLSRLSEINPETLAVIIRVLIAPDLARQPLKPIWYRAVVLAHVLHVRGIGERSLASLAKEMGCTRSLLTNYAVRLRDFGGLDCRAGKSMTARAAMSERRLWRPSNRRGKTAKKADDSNDRLPHCSQVAHNEESEDLTDQLTDLNFASD